MTPQLSEFLTRTGGIVAVVWGIWLAGRLVLFGWRRTRKRAARRLVPGATVRTEFSATDRRVILCGPVLGWRRTCRRCWRRRAAHVDHLIPDRAGGGTDRSNGCPLCARCNERKGARWELWAVLRWVTPWWGWRCPVPMPVLMGAAVVGVVLAAT